MPNITNCTPWRLPTAPLSPRSATTTRTTKERRFRGESSDGGQTWTTPHSIGVWGLPSHLLLLQDKNLLMTYGYRRKPYGNKARLSRDHGRSWSDPVTLSNDGGGGDLGYPSSVQLKDGSFLSVWYERFADSPRAVLRQARWSLRAVSSEQ